MLESDQRLWTDASTKTFVQRFLGVRGLSGLNFNVEFGKSMVKMSNVGVKTGTEGEIRKVCSSINWSCTLWLSIYLSEVKNRYYSVTSHLHRESVIMIQLIPKSKVWMEILMHGWIYGCLLNIDAPFLFIDWKVDKVGTTILVPFALSGWPPNFNRWKLSSDVIHHI